VGRSAKKQAIAETEDLKKKTKIDTDLSKLQKEQDVGACKHGFMMGLCKHGCTK
jgi:hypothetical protein